MKIENVNLTIRPIISTEIETFVRWRYQPPADTYNMLSDEGDGDEYDEIFLYFLEPNYHCSAILHEGELVGFCTFGDDGRVQGGDYSQPAVDIGMGMKPEWMDKKRGDNFIAAIIQYAHDTFAPPRLRVTIDVTNLRAQRVWQKAGFVQQARFVCPRNEKTFSVLVGVNDSS